MIHRNINSSLLDALDDNPVVLLHGARQTGKSTLVKHLASKEHPARYLTFDDASVMAAAHNDPAGFLAGLEGNVVIDEVQRVPDIFLAIKMEVDRDRTPGRFLLTGSADVLLIPHLSESLAGRMEILTLWPFSQGEIEGVREGFLDVIFTNTLPKIEGVFEDRGTLINGMLMGGYPEILKRATIARRRAWFNSYITTILQRDIRDFSHIEGLTTLPRLLSLLAARATSLMNFSELSRSISIPQTTLKRYLMLLETAFLVQLLPPWSSNLSKRLVKSPKLLISDSGLMAHLVGLNSERLSLDLEKIGALIENFVVMELRKQTTWSETQVQLYYYRTQTGQEVDVILEDIAGRIVGIEVKASTTVTAQDFKSLRSLEYLLGRRFHRGILLYTGSECIPFGSKFHALPISSLWRLGVRRGPAKQSNR